VHRALRPARSWRGVLPGRSASGRAPGGRGRDDGRARASGRQPLRLVRLLVATPWFAAGAGMVIAAAVALDSPAALTYGPAAPGVHCSADGCAGPVPSHGPGVATGSPGVPFRDPGVTQGGAAAANSGAPGSAEAGNAAGYEVGYQILKRSGPGFVAIITMPGGLKPGLWSLEFAFPAARVERVWGARWKPSGNGQAGTAVGPWQWRGHAPHVPDAHQLTVLATGTPSTPSSCRIDGVSCSFG
jgi:hypothetical protein